MSIKIALVYARADEQFARELQFHLQPLIGKGDITVWSDQLIAPGEVWDKMVKKNLHNSDIFIFLVSSHFLNSKYIQDVETKIIFERQENNEVVIIPIIVRPSMWETDTRLSMLQVLPRGGKPISTWKDIDSAWFDVVGSILKVITRKKIEENKEIIKEIPPYSKPLEDKISQLLEKLEYQPSEKHEPRVSFYPFWGDLALDRQEDLCFVLMPFSIKSLSDIYKRYIKKSIETRYSLKCIRSDDIYSSNHIMKDVWEKINTAKVIIADLTGKNPNVFYELGIAHTLGKKVILISQNIDDVPFDLRGVRVIIFENSLDGYDYLEATLIKYISEIL